MAADATEIKEFIKDLNRGSTIPAMLGKILDLVRDETSSSRELGELISYDQSLAEMVLRMANSAMFGHSGNIRDIEQAIMFLGYRQIRSIAAGVSVLKIFPADQSMRVKDLWVHGYKVAFISNKIAQNIPTLSSKESFLSGLLHDMGRLIFYMKDAAAFLEIGCPPDLLEKEREVFGCTHEQAGGWYIEETKLPEEIGMPIMYHHRPDSAPSYKDTVAVVSLADALSMRLTDEVEGDGYWGPQHDEIMNRFSFSEDDIITIGEALGGINKELEIFFG